MQSENKISLPVAIAFAGILIAGSIMYGKVGTPTNNAAQVAEVAAQDSLNSINPISANDHVRGSRDADVFIVEYSDTECPFCKRFHDALKQVMAEYQSGGKVAWVYRHFPLDQLHSKARNEALALECAAEIGGNDKFWQYTDRIYEITPSNDGLDPLELPKIAQYIGLDVAKFNECLTSQRHMAKVDADLQNAVATGGAGTPWSIIVAKDGTKYPLSGAQPYEAIKQMVESALSKN